jgi:DeoR family transcriptional regulator of aga operon
MGKKIVERRNTILNMVNKYGTLEFPQIRAAFPDISDVTLRKDLQYLDDTKQAIRTHGGIKSIPSALNYIYRANVNQEQKQEIASKAAKLIQPDNSIFISAGTTCAELARRLPVFPLKVCSDGICTISNISTLPNISVELLGGDVDLNIMRVEGISVLNRLDALHFSMAFMGALNMNLDYGFAHNSALTVAILEKVIAHSDKVVVLLDSTKISHTFYPNTISLSSVDIVVSDNRFPDDIVEKLRRKGIEVLI